MRYLLRWLSLRHLIGAPLRSTLTVLGVAVGVATMVGVTALNRAVVDAFRSTVDTIAGKADLTVAATESGFDEALLETVRQVPGVAHATSALTVIAPVDGSPGESLYVMGLDFLDDGYFRTLEGVDRDVGALADDLQFLNSTDRLLLSERFAREHGLKAGDTVRLATPTGVQPFIVHGLLRETGPVKAFGGSVAIMDLASAQEAFRRGRRIDRIDVAVDPKAHFEQVQAALQRATGPAFEVERPSRRGSSVEKMVLSFQMGLNLGSGVALMVGVFLVYNTVAIGVLQRRREIGMLRALGATRRSIRALFTLEALLLGGLGTAIGLPLGGAVARGALSAVSKTISSIYVQVNAREVKVQGWQLLLGIVFGLGGSAIAALRPAVHASAVQPVEALRKDVFAGAEIGTLRTWPTWMGVAALIAVFPITLLPDPIENFPLGGYISVFLVIGGATFLSPVLLRSSLRLFAVPSRKVLGIAGRLAAENFARSPGRTAVPVSALAIGVAMTLCIGGFIHSFQASSERWIDQSVPADLFVTSSAKLGGVQNQPMAPELGEALERIPGVRKVDRVRVFPHELLGLRIEVLSLIPEIYGERGRLIVLSGHAPNVAERRERHLAISENLARRRQLHVGDSFEMSTGTGVHRYIVDAIVLDYTSDQGTVLMDRELFVRDFGDDRVDTFELYLADLKSLPSVRKQVLAQFGAKYDLYVLTNAELRQEAKELIENAFSVTYAMETVAVILALLGVINTLLAAVLDRTREIGLLRALGADRRQVRRLFIGEAALIGLTGGLIGIASGSVMGLLVIKIIGAHSTGWVFPFVFPWRLAVQMALAATGCSILAGIYPARRAARLEIVEALAYE